MKIDGKYRFSLQFGADSEERIRIGELLESLGNKKSAFVVAALREYLQLHPEFNTSGCSIKIKTEYKCDMSEVEKIIRRIIEEKFSGLQNAPLESDASELKNIEQDFSQAQNTDQLSYMEKTQYQSTEDGVIRNMEEDIAQMLENLDMFQ